LDVIPAKFRVIVTRRPKYAYRNRDGVIQAPAPSHIIERGIRTETLLAQIAVSKYADGLPLYSSIGRKPSYARDEVELGRSLMAQWMGNVASNCSLYRTIFRNGSSRANESLPMRPPCRLWLPDPATQKVWLWAYARRKSVLDRKSEFS
jgi:transposase